MKKQKQSEAEKAKELAVKAKAAMETLSEGWCGVPVSGKVAK